MKLSVDSAISARSATAAAIARAARGAKVVATPERLREVDDRD